MLLMARGDFDLTDRNPLDLFYAQIPAKSNIYYQFQEPVLKDILTISYMLLYLICK